MSIIAQLFPKSKFSQWFRVYSSCITILFKAELASVLDASKTYSKCYSRTKNKSESPVCMLVLPCLTHETKWRTVLDYNKCTSVLSTINANGEFCTLRNRQVTRDSWWGRWTWCVEQSQTGDACQIYISVQSSSEREFHLYRFFLRLRAVCHGGGNNIHFPKLSFLAQGPLSIPYSCSAPLERVFSIAKAGWAS